jgi:hypothetical protein
VRPGAALQVAPQFRELDPGIHPLLLVNCDHVGNGRRVADAYYRIGTAVAR